MATSLLSRIILTHVNWAMIKYYKQYIPGYIQENIPHNRPVPPSRNKMTDNKWSANRVNEVAKGNFNVRLEPQPWWAQDSLPATEEKKDWWGWEAKIHLRTSTATPKSQKSPQWATWRAMGGRWSTVVRRQRMRTSNNNPPPVEDEVSEVSKGNPPLDQRRNLNSPGTYYWWLESYRISAATRICPLPTTGDWKG